MAPRLRQLAPPDPGEVHVWVVDLEVDGTHATALQRRLPPRERARGKGCGHEARKRRYVVRQAALRSLIAAYGDAPIAMSVSDSHELAVVALTCEGPLGVDVERLDARRPAMRIARRFFSGLEQQALEALDEDARLEEFYRRWTAREAWAKASGTALPLTLALFAGDERSERALRVEDLESGTAPWLARGIDVRPGYVATLVGHPHTARVRVRSWCDMGPRPEGRARG